MRRRWMSREAVRATMLAEAVLEQPTTIRLERPTRRQCVWPAPRAIETTARADNVRRNLNAGACEVGPNVLANRRAA